MELPKFRFSHALLVLLLGLLLTQCRKDEINTEVIPSSLGDNANVSFLITVKGENGEQIQNSTVNIDNQSQDVNADENGVIIINSITIPKSGVKSEFSAEGYESQTVRLVGSSGVVNLISITMVKLQTKLMDTGSEGEISGGSFIELPSTLEYANGDSYAGTVSVRSKYLNSTEADFLSTTLGNMQALNEEGEYKLLGSVGMILITLFDDTGNELFLSAGTFAKLKIPLASVQQGTDVSKLKVWSFDEDSAIWNEAASVSKEDEMLMAEVGSLSWINFDQSFDFYQSRVSFFDANNRVVPNLKVSLYANEILFNEMYINDANIQSLSMPVNEDLSVRYSYGNNEYQQSIGVHNGVQTEHTIVLEELSAYLIDGRAVNCQNQFVDQGYAILSQGGMESVFYINQGSFSYLNPIKNHKIELIDLSSDNSKKIDINIIQDDIPLGELLVCEEGFGQVSGYVILDSDEDGVGDTPLENITINLSSNAANFQEVTDADGYYEFSFLQTDSVFLMLDIDPNQYVIFQSGDESPESMDEIIGFEVGYPIKNLIVQDDEDNNFILINQGNGILTGTYLADTDGDGLGDVPLEWMTINSLTEGNIGYVDTDGTFNMPRQNGHGDLWIGFYDYLSDYDSSPDPDGDDSSEGPNGKIPFFINTNEVDADNNFVINLDFSAIAVQVLEDTNGDGVGDIPVVEGQVTIKHVVSGSVIIGSIVDLSENRYAIQEFGVNLSDSHEVTINLPFLYDIVSIEDLSPDNDPVPSGDTMKVSTIGAEWDGGNTFTIRRI